MPQTRQLAAIMFTDIAGYTALMGDDEQAAFELLKQNRELQKPLIEKYSGKWIKEIGDAVLASFSTVTDAVLCAIEIQHSSQQFPKLQLRLGIHQGEVVFENEDVFGEGVNIASRLQALAPVGGIWISESVYKNVSNKKGISAKFIREEVLKNVKNPVKVYEVITGSSKNSNNHQPTKNILEKTIAVLPFVNMSNDPEQEYFSDGMAEEILNSLSHLKDLKVAGRTSSFQFKGKNIDLKEVGEKLHVHNVLEGSVRKQGNRLRITAQLINLEDGFHIWSEKYDRDMDDIFAIQDEIALAITEKLKIILLGNDREIITKSHTQNTAAYELYLKGRFYLSKRGKSIFTALKYFKEAIDVDPEFAIAYAGYADANILLAFYSLKPGIEIMNEVKQAAEKAIQLDPSLCEPYASLGFYYTALERNWQEGKKYFDKSLELNPNYVFANYSYALHYYLYAKGNIMEAKKLVYKALKLEPLSAVVHAVYGIILFAEHKFEEAISICKAGIELDANSFLCYRCLIFSFKAMKNYDEAIETAQYLINLTNRHPHALTDLIFIYRETGRFEEAKILMNELKMRATHEFMASTYMGLCSVSIDDMEDAYAYFEKALIEHDPMLITFKNIEYIDFLKGDQRFQKLLEKIGF